MKQLLYAALIFTYLGSFSAFARQVLLEGLNPSEEAKVTKKFHSLKGQNNSLAVLDKVTQYIMSMNRFESVEIVVREDGHFIIVATPLRKVKDIIIEGNQSASRSEILDMIDLKTDENFEKRRILEIGERLKSLYGEKGFFNTIIEVAFEKVDNRTMNIKFTISEGLPCRIANIEVRSKNPALNNQLSHRVSSFKGRVLTNSQIVQINERIKNYLMDKKYYSSDMKGPSTSYNDEKSQASLIFELSDPYQYQIFIEGANPNTPFHLNKDPFKYQNIPAEKRHLPSESDVLRAITYTDGEKSGVDPEAEMSNKIRNFYLNRGYPEVKIKTQRDQLEESLKRTLTFQIQTGPKVKIVQWKIEGRISRAEEYYTEFIQENSSNLIQKNYYNSEDLSLGQKNLITELRNQGFLMAKIQSTRIEYLGRSKSRAKITINLDEGPLTQVRRLDFIGNKKFSDMDLEKIFTVKSNSPLRLQSLEASIETLKKFYLDRGFLEMKLLNEVKNIVQYNEKGTHANIEIRIYEGPQISVKSILIEGNSKTQSSVIKRALSFEPGETLTPEKIEDSILYLNRTGIFSRVAINTLEQGTDKEARTVVISVDERDPGLWRLGAGVNSERELTARTFTGVSYNNIGGSMRGISSRLELSSNIADINYLEHRITAGYLEPFLFGSRTKGRVNVTRSDEVYNTTRPIGYDDVERVELLTRNRVDFLLETDLTRDLKMTWTAWGLDSRTTRERKFRCPDDPTQYCPEETLQIANIGPVFALDYRDNPFLPRDGNYSRLGVDYAAPFLGSSTGIEFAKVEGTYRHYFPFFKKKLVWANELRSGYLTNLSNAKCSDSNTTNCNGVPVSHAFLLGGFSTVRGYDFASTNNRIPKSTDEEEPNGNSRLPVTGANRKVIKTDSHFYMIKTELRFPIYGEFGGVLFYDGGAVLVSGYKFKDPYRESVGFGFRYNTPVGPVSMDIGFKLDPQEDESATDFHFSIGTF